MQLPGIFQESLMSKSCYLGFISLMFYYHYHTFIFITRFMMRYDKCKCFLQMKISLRIIPGITKCFHQDDFFNNSDLINGIIFISLWQNHNYWIKVLDILIVFDFIWRPNSCGWKIFYALNYTAYKTINLCLIIFFERVLKNNGLYGSIIKSGWSSREHSYASICLFHYFV